jgi:fatty-acyl-CoA synthase
MPAGHKAGTAVAGLCKEKLARFKVPGHFLFLDPAGLPATPTGKCRSSGSPGAPPGT